MPHITLSIDEDLLKKGREYARKHRISLNRLIRRLLQNTVQPSSNDWMDACFLEMDRANGNSKGEKWSKEDLYRE